MKKIILFVLILSLLIPSFIFAEETPLTTLEKSEAVKIANEEIKVITKDERNYYEEGKINNEIWKSHSIMAYGIPFGDKKGDATRYLGKTPEGQDITNYKFPHDDWVDKSLDSRKWIEYPWKINETLNSGAFQSEFNNNPDYEQAIIQGMNKVYGKFLTGEKKDWYKSVQILQPPTSLSWGLGRMWHQGNTKIFYITIPIAPLTGTVKYNIVQIIENDSGEVVEVKRQSELNAKVKKGEGDKFILEYPLVSPPNTKFIEWVILDKNLDHKSLTWEKVIANKILNSGDNPLLATYEFLFSEHEQSIVYARYVEREKGVDFSINASTDSFVAYKDEGNINLTITSALNNSKEDITTEVKTYKENSQIKSETKTYKNKTPQTINLTINESDLKLGENIFNFIINSDLNLTKATPYIDEEDLTNNKTTVKIIYKERVENTSKSCEFKGTGDSKEYINKILIPKTCSDGKGGSYDCSYYVCDTANPKTYSLERSSEVNFFEQKIFSNDWHKSAMITPTGAYIGQEYGKKHNLPFGKDLKGNDAKDELMSAIGFNPLRQVIQAGAGIQLKTNIKITGYIENFDNYIPENYIQAYIDEFRYKTTFVSGETTFKHIKNNEGNLLQKMEYDTSRSDEYKKDIDNIGTETYGHKDCKQIRVFKTKFEFEIPMIISQAKGTINVIGGKKAEVPKEKKWFVYLNNFDDIYQLGLQTTLKPSMLGLALPDADCIDSPSNYKIGISGTMFDNVNTGNESNNDTPIWDN